MEALFKSTRAKLIDNALSLVFAALVGGIIGFAAWGSGTSPAVAVLLPVVIAFSATRSHAFVVGAAYTLLVMRHTASFIGGWFDDSMLVGTAAVALYVVLSAGVWSLGWSASDNPLRKSLAVVLAWVVALLPPAALWIAGNPMIGWGVLMPSLGWLGVLASVAVPAAVVYVAARLRLDMDARAQLVAGATLPLVALGLLSTVPAVSVSDTAMAVRTHFGQVTGADDVLERLQSMGEVAKRIGDKGVPITVIWPESVIGEYDTAFFPIIKLEILNRAKTDRQTHVIGMDVPVMGTKKQLNAAVAMMPDGTSVMAQARQPAPVSLWRPWSKVGFVADWRASNLLPLGGDKTAAVIFCYEEYMPILYLLNEAIDRPDVYVAMSNTWAARSEEQAEIQGQHSRYMASMFGRPYLKAENRPKN